MRLLALVALAVAALPLSCRSREERDTGTARVERVEVAKRLADGAAASSAERIPTLRGFAIGPLEKIGPFEVGWSPQKGTGPLVQSFEDGSRIEICLQCGFRGYTGGLSIGSESAPGFLWVPARPIRGFRSLSIWCAFDETLYEPSSGDSYGFGWSQNFGEKGGGRRLEYVNGEVLLRSADMVLLRATSLGGCYRVTRRLKWMRGDRYVVLFTTIENVCPHEVEIDYWLGEDPWIGTYRSSEGDVGWVALGGEGGLREETVRTERSVEAARVVCAGLHDLGNARAGEVEGGFSDVANFIRLSPTTSAPSAVYFANRFAHEEGEIRSDLPLDDGTMTALNIGWRGIRLGPAERFSLAWALGIAEERPGRSEPRCPEIPPDRFSPHPVSGATFRREQVSIEIAPTSRAGVFEGRVRGSYVISGAGARSQEIDIFFPFYQAPGVAPPHSLSVRGAAGPHTSRPGGISFPVEVPADGEAELTIEYAQQVTGCAYGYVTTSARLWPLPVERAAFTVVYPASIALVEETLGSGFDLARAGDRVVRRATFESFSPERDIEVSWRCDELAESAADGAQGDADRDQEERPGRSRDR